MNDRLLIAEAPDAVRRRAMLIAVGGLLTSVASTQSWATFSSVHGIQTVVEMPGTNLVLGLVTLGCGVLNTLIGLRVAQTVATGPLPVATAASAIALISVGGAAGIFILRPGGAFDEYGNLLHLDLGLWAAAAGAALSGLSAALRRRPLNGNDATRM